MENEQSNLLQEKHTKTLNRIAENKKKGLYLTPIVNDRNAVTVYQEGTYAKDVLELNERYNDYMNFAAQEKDGYVIGGTFFIKNNNRTKKPHKNKTKLKKYKKQ